jgi:hypothetical protein
MSLLGSSYSIAPESVSSINRNFVNSDASDPPAFLFSSSQNPGSLSINPRVLPEPINNIQAANSKVFGMTGGKGKKWSAKKHIKKINNISNMYKMKGNKGTIRKRIRKIKSRIRSKFGTKSRKSHKRSNRRGSQHLMRGGYSQYMNNYPDTPSYSTGGILPPSLSALASPTPFTRLANINGIDNLNHNALNSFGKSGSGMGFPSRGSY